MMHWYRPIANFYQIQVSVSMLTTIFCCWAFGEIVVDKGDREEHKMEKVVTKNWGMDKSAATDIITTTAHHIYLLDAIFPSSFIVIITGAS